MKLITSSKYKNAVSMSMHFLTLVGEGTEFPNCMSAYLHLTTWRGVWQDHHRVQSIVD